MAEKIAVPVDTGTKQRQAGMADVKLFVVLLGNKSIQIFTCGVSF